VRRLLVAASDVPSSPILVTLIKVALSSSETSVLIRATRRDIPEDTVLHSHRRENLKSYKYFHLKIQGIIAIAHCAIFNLFMLNKRNYYLYIYWNTRKRSLCLSYPEE
jgi:hypothetical protein